MTVLKMMFEIGLLEHELFSDSFVSLTKGNPCLFNHQDAIKLARILSETAEKIKETNKYQVKYRCENDHFTILKEEYMYWIAIKELNDFIDFINCSGGFSLVNSGNIVKDYEFAGYCSVTKNKSWKPEITKQTNTIQREKTKELILD